MAIVAFHGLAWKGQLTFHRPLFYCFHKARQSNSFAAVESLVETASVKKKEALPRGNNGDYKALEWKKLSSAELGIQTSMIAGSTRLVLNGLRKKGYDVYLVGGCVRDLILNRTPKDFDIITSAELKEETVLPILNCMQLFLLPTLASEQPCLVVWPRFWRNKCAPDPRISFFSCCMKLWRTHLSQLYILVNWS